MSVTATETDNVQYVTPADGATVTLTNAFNNICIIEPAGLLAALTATFPSSNLQDKQTQTLCCAQIVTTLTLSGGTLIGALTAFAVGGFAKYMYRSATAKWYRIG